MSLLSEPAGMVRRAGRLDRVVLATAALLSGLALTVPQQAAESLGFVLEAFLSVGPFLVASILIAAGAKATGLDRQIAGVFSGHPFKAVILAAAVGSLSPFCSCGIVPLIAGLLVAGVPLAPVMAFWLSSPLMDPQMFLLMTPVFGLPMTVAKLLAAFSIGALAGFSTHFIMRAGGFANPLRPGLVAGGCGASRGLERSPIVMQFWREPERRHQFAGESRSMGWFLCKWLFLAFLLESLMIAWVPADQIGALLGGDAWWAIPASVAFGIPAYLNGFAAIPTVSALMELGMAPGAGLGFMLAGGVTCIPAAVAVLALVRPPVFVWYAGCGLAGSLAAAWLFQAYVAAAGLSFA